MTDYSAYRPDTGRITQAGNFSYRPEHLDQLLGMHKQNPDDQIVRLWGNEKTQRVDITTGAIVSRPAFPCQIDKTAIKADGKDVVTISHVPPGTLVMGVQVADGIFEFTTTLPGTHRFKLSLFPFVDTEIRVEAS